MVTNLTNTDFIPNEAMKPTNLIQKTVLLREKLRELVNAEAENQLSPQDQTNLDARSDVLPTSSHPKHTPINHLKGIGPKVKAITKFHARFANSFSQNSLADANKSDVVSYIYPIDINMLKIDRAYITHPRQTG